jgi:hypothetical protein
MRNVLPSSSFYFLKNFILRKKNQARIDGLLTELSQSFAKLSPMCFIIELHVTAPHG